jgi:hypothetical protein
MVKVKPAMPGSITVISQVIVSDHKFTCTLNPTISGDYQIDAFITTGQSKVTLTPQINSFSYFSLPPHLEGRLYDLAKQIWINYTQNKSIVIDVSLVYNIS